MALTDGLNGLQARAEVALGTARETATIYAERILGRLDAIVDGVQALDSPESERVSASVRVNAGETKKITEGRPGWMMTVEHVSVVTDGAAVVDIHVGSAGNEGFRTRLETAAAGKAGGGLVGYKVPESGAVFAILSGAGGAMVNVQVKRERVY